MTTQTAQKLVKTQALLQRWNRSKPAEKHEAQELIEEIAAFYDKHDIKEDQALKVFDIVFSVMRKNNIHCERLRLEVNSDGYDQWLSLVAEIRGSREKINALDDQLIDEMVLRDMRDNLTDLLLRFSLRFRRVE